MRKSIDFRILRHIAFAAFLVPFATTGHAQEGVLRVEVERKIDLDVTIEPQIISLVRSPVNFEGRSEGASGGTLDIIITPDRKMADTPPSCGGIICELDRVATIIEGAESTLGPEIMTLFAQLNAGTLDRAKQVYGDATTMNVSFRNDPAAASALTGAGYTDLGLQGLKLKGEIYRMTRWSKYTPAGDGPGIGTATSHVNIHSGARIDYGSVTFWGAFDTPEDISFELRDPPADAAQFEAVAQQFEEYKAAVRSRLSEVLSHLNEPRRLLNDEETEQLFKATIGETLSFSKTIKFDWYDEQKTVNVVVVATVTDNDDPEVPTGQPTDFFEFDEGWPYLPDVADEWGVVP